MPFPHFIDDSELAKALEQAASAAWRALRQALPELEEDAPFWRDRLRHGLAQQLMTESDDGSRLVFGDDIFGDPFDLDRLPLPRPGSAYAVQRLDTDHLLDRQRNAFLPIRTPELKPEFADFDSACSAARHWLQSTGSDPEAHPMAVVPVCMDTQLQRHVLIYGVLKRRP